MKDTELFGTVQGGETMEKKMAEIGERMRRAREHAGYSQEALASLLECSPITISRWENGHTPMKVQDIVKIVKLLGISADYLLGMEDDNEAEVQQILGSLNHANREIACDTVRAMVAAMKRYQK